jgi:hypothetical protein
MRKSDIELLRTSVGKVIRVHCRDGELFVGKAVSVSEEEQDLIYELISTSRESQYEKADQQPAYMIKFDDSTRWNLARTNESSASPLILSQLTTNPAPY